MTMPMAATSIARAPPIRTTRTRRARCASHSEIHTWVNVICVGVVVLAFLFSVGAVWQFVPQRPAAFRKSRLHLAGRRLRQDWFSTHYSGKPAEFKAEAGFLLDPLSSIWLLFVTGVGMLIHIYSIGYMAHEGGYYRFFGYLNLFMFSMLTLILAQQLHADVCGLGGRGAVLVPADRLLLPEAFGIDGGEQGVHHQPHWRRRRDPGLVHHHLAIWNGQVYRGHRAGPRHAGQIIADPH